MSNKEVEKFSMLNNFTSIKYENFSLIIAIPMPPERTEP